MVQPKSSPDLIEDTLQKYNLSVQTNSISDLVIMDNTKGSGKPRVADNSGKRCAGREEILRCHGRDDNSNLRPVVPL
jgi:hypothetical protein